LTSAASEDIVGFRVFGRHGELGVVVGVRDERAEPDSRVIVVLGGVSDALTYYVPAARVRALSSEHRSVHVDVDLTDFVPHLHEDGTIELRASS